MKILNSKRKIIIILITIFLLSSIIGTYQAHSIYNENRQDFNWVIMVYLNGDNVLSAAQGQILEEIRQVGSTENVQFTILIDQNQDDDTRLYYLVGNTLDQQSWEIESSMDDADTIRDYVLQVKSDFLADYYELIISSNKGSAWQGICWDDHGDGIMITMPELLSALNEITENGSDKLDIIGFETCMTGNFEVAYQIKSCCNIMMAYPECAIIGDWPYSEAFDDLISDSSMTPTEYANVTVNHFTPKYVPQYDMKTVMSAIDLSYIDDMGIELNDLSGLFIEDIDEYKDDIETAILNSRVYAKSWDIDYYIDLFHFLDILSINNPDIIETVGTIKDIMNNAIIKVSHIIDDDSYGLNFYHPRRKSDYNSSLRYNELPSPFEDTEYAKETLGDEYLKTYLGIYENNPPETPDIDGLNKGKPGIEYEYLIVTIDSNNDDVYYFIEWGDGEIKEWFGPFPSGEEIKVNHTWSEKGTYIVKVKAKDTLNAESSWGTIEIKMPFNHIRHSSRIVLIGRISNFEKTQDNNFRFLPVNLIEMTKLDDQQRTIGILGETYGPYPCCGYIHKWDFMGIVTSKIVFGIWLIPENV